jgi:PEP-CTERM motif
VGGQVILNDNGTGSVLTNFDFWVASPTDETITVAIYDQTGLAGAPGNKLWSDSFNSSDLQAGGLTNELNETLNLAVPSSFTWTVQLSGNGGPALVTNAPAISGGFYRDYWWNKGSDSAPNWQLYVDPNGGIINFAADFSGTPNPTPEPSSLALIGLGCLAVGSYAKRSKKSA